MIGRDKYIKKRIRFCKLAFEDNKKAAKELKSMARSLENCRNSSDVIYALSEIYAVSERTITNDIQK